MAHLRKEEQVSVIIEMGFGFDDIDQILDLSEFLSNSRELLEDFEPEVSRFLVKKDFFKGPFLKEYNNQFDNLVQTLIKKELTKCFTTWTPEDILKLTDDLDFLKMLAADLFDQDSYRKIKLT